MLNRIGETACVSITPVQRVSKWVIHSDSGRRHAASALASSENPLESSINPLESVAGEEESSVSWLK